MRESVDDFTVLITSYPDGDVLSPDGSRQSVRMQCKEFQRLACFTLGSISMCS